MRFDYNKRKKQILVVMKKISVIILLIVVLFFVTSNLSLQIYSLESKKSEEIKQLYRQYYRIRKLEASKEYHEAVTECKKIIEQHSDFYDIFRLFARISKNADQLQESYEYFQQLNQKNPNKTEFYYGLGLCYKAQEKYDKASESYKKAIDLGARFIRVYYDLLIIAKTKQDSQDLIDYFQEKATLQPKNSLFYYGIGAIYEYKLKEYTLALENYHKGVRMARASGDKLEEGQHLNMIGSYYWNRSNFTKALEHYLEAVNVIQNTEDKTELPRCLYNCGLMHCYLGKWQKGRECYHRALTIDREIGNKIHEAQLLRSIGYTHYQSSQYAQAFDYYKAAFKIARETGDITGEARYSADIAKINWIRGNYSLAIESYKNSLRRFQEIGDKYNEGNTLNDIGNTFWKIGDFSRALEYYLQALKVNREAGIKHQESKCLNNIGIVYHAIGHYGKALDYYHKALKIQRDSGSRSSEGATLNNVAGIYSSQKDYPQAFKYYHQAMEIAREIGNKRSEANRLNNVAIVYSKLGEFSEAQRFHAKAVRIAKDIGTKDIESSIFRDMGYSFLSANKYSASIESFKKAIFLAQDLGLPKTKWLAYSGIGEAYEKQDQFSKALNNYYKAIKVIEDIRSQLQLEEQKSGFLEDKVKVYVSLINLLFELHQERSLEGFDRESYFIAERAKARGFLDSLQTAKVNFRAQLSPELRVEEYKLTREISNIQTELIKPGLTELRKKELFRNLENAEESYLNLIQKIRRENQEYAQLVYPEPYQLKAIQERLLDKETAIIEYVTGEKNTFMFYISQNDFVVLKLSKCQDFQGRVHDYIKLLTTRDDREFRALAAGKRLFRELIGPVKDKFASIKRLIIIPDGNLNFLPFEALIVPDSVSASRFLVEDYQISYAPSASSLVNLLARERSAAHEKDLLAFADPEHTYMYQHGSKLDADVILREFYLEQGFDFSPLRYSGKEVKKISRFIKRKSRDVYTKAEAKEEKIKELPLNNYKIIHFATHGLIDEKVPLRSSLILTLDEDPNEDGFFQAREIYNSEMNSDLVVLSACQTGKGKLEKGEGVTGLSRAFLYAGAQSVVTSLWSINDKATSIFMGYFYESLSQGMTKTEALQRAKMRMIKSGYKHPFYWAAFVLNGEFRSAIKIEKPLFWERIF